MLVTDALEFLDNLESKMEKLSLEILKKVQQKEQRSGYSYVDSWNWIHIIFGRAVRDWKLP